VGQTSSTSLKERARGKCIFTSLHVPRSGAGYDSGELHAGLLKVSEQKFITENSDVGKHINILGSS